MSEDQQLYQQAYSYLQSRGYSNPNARLNMAQPGDGEHLREEKLNEMVARDAMRKATRGALQLHSTQPVSYPDSWVQLSQWLVGCPTWQQRELMPMYFVLEFRTLVQLQQLSNYVSRREIATRDKPFCFVVGFDGQITI